MENGLHRVSEWRPAGDGLVSFRIVLRKLNGHHPWVTHIQRKSDMSFNTGAYNPTEKEGHDSFEKRCAKWGVKEHVLNSSTLPNGGKG